ncbi:type VI secretion system baseplate subunit TssF [Vibrio sp. ZSDZ65]|uniref:Type VI secretion system baseplate subunit TssF n=1 Tax=Vibrio qingdaonensis TaxID=2829491 RepID=A0A9X3HUT7_9VIBR|nr:type VI secretion system baseplate subunit TssF [Vibrio qingdaonensis]MCW8344586.1 type VI secretion system baseplate subunit TssF [Vibrio qingdaonensis]
MTDPLLRYYERELTFLRRALGHYSDEHSQFASALNLHQGQIEDPSIARLLDGVALLNAKTEMALKNQIPSIVESIINVIYPSLNQTTPSVGYAELVAAEPIAELSELPKGSRLASTIGSHECLFQTVDRLHINPFNIDDVIASTAPFPISKPERAELANGLLQIKLSTGDDDILFSTLQSQELDFFVKGFANNAESLVEMLLANGLAISISDSQGNTLAQLEQTALSNRVCDPSFHFLPQKGQQFDGYQMIREFFLFKEKRQFFQLVGFKQAISTINDSTLFINFFLSDIPAEFLRLFNTDVIKLNVVPIINLFTQTSEPIDLDGRKLAYPIAADAFDDSPIDIIDVLSVRQITSYGDKTLTPMFGEKYHQKRSDINQSPMYWEAKKDLDKQYELVVSHTHDQSEKAILVASLLSSNGKLACSVSGQLDSLENIDLPGELTLLYPPSAPVEMEANDDNLSQVIALLCCNFNSLLRSEDPTKQIKDMFKLFSSDTTDLDEINSIHNIAFKTQVSTLRVHNKNIFVPGTEIYLELNTDMPHHAFTLVLNEFFKQFCSFDRYIQLHVSQYGKQHRGITFPKAHGGQLCL